MAKHSQDHTELHVGYKIVTGLFYTHTHTQQSGAQLYANRFGMNVSFVVANPDPPPVTEEPVGLSNGAIAESVAVVVLVTLVLVTLVLLVLFAVGYYCW